LTTILTQPIKWHGGKHYLAQRIIALMPPHVHYVEPFFGGGSVLLQKDPEGVSEVVNDLNYELATFWAVLRSPEWFDAFVRLVEATPFSEALFDANGEQHYLPTDNSPVASAWRFFIRARQSRQGLTKDFATLSRNRTRRGMNEQVSSWLTAIEGLPDVHARLKRVVILNRDAIDVIRSQDGPNTLFYCDPPYLHETRVTTSDYAHEMTPVQHRELLDVLSKIAGKFILSGYPSALYHQVESACGWHRLDIQIDNKASSAKEKEIKTESLWCNFPIRQEERAD
jgi:DNA adenine methylase